MAKGKKKVIATIDFTSSEATQAFFASITRRADDNPTANGTAAAAATPSPAAGKKGRGNGNHVSTEKKIALFNFAIKYAKDYRVMKDEMFSNMLREFCNDHLNNPINNPFGVLQQCVDSAHAWSEYRKTVTDTNNSLSNIDQLSLSWDEIVKSKTLTQQQRKRRREHKEEERHAADQLRREMENWRRHEEEWKDEPSDGSSEKTRTIASCVDWLDTCIEEHGARAEKRDTFVMDKTRIQISQDGQYKGEIRKEINDLICPFQS
ncbi:hypothetical protein KEM56_001990 [Ascosphaera pollenicola]|nr:hypothetical protein KEM56_001990 [Ascosphaera pollenicola]